MSRSTARENLFKLIYERCVNGESNPLTFNLVFESETENQKAYFLSVYEGINAEFDFLIDIVVRHSTDFAIDRVFKVDLSILLIAMYEILFLDDIPDVVSINEAVELAKIYSTPKSSVFINGLLAVVKRDKEIILKQKEENQ